MSSFHQGMSALLDAVRPRLDALVAHPLYAELTSIGNLRRFMEHHVFVVWDFMCLLKALQQRLTCTAVHWSPVGDPRVRRLINEIVLGEESDELPDGRVLSHFELYVEAMSEAGTDPSRVMAFQQRQESSQPARTALSDAGIPRAVREHVLHTLDVVEDGRLHVMAAAFSIGRERVIPPMFLKIVGALAEANPRKLDLFGLYLERHVELDRDQHGPLANQMLAYLCGSDPSRWEEAALGAISALEARGRLWDAVHEGFAATPEGLQRFR